MNAKHTVCSILPQSAMFFYNVPQYRRYAIDRLQLTRLLAQVKAEETTIEEALEALSQLPFQDLGFAKVDHHRALRKGFPEVILGEGKTPEQIANIAQAINNDSSSLLITRIDASAYETLKARIPDTVYNATARIAYLQRDRVALKPGVTVACAGTSDIPVAEEAAITAELVGSQVERVYDAGVAGLHRLLSELPKLRSARVVVVVAGMDGALPSVVGGLVAVPVIAVPTSIGYGASFQGLSALLAMLASCAPGVTVVNIDNGFGAGYQAAMINRDLADHSPTLPGRTPRSASSGKFHGTSRR